MAIKTSVIVNDDGTTGYVSNANKFLYSDDYQKKYSLLKALSQKPAANKYVVDKVGGTSGKSSLETANPEVPSILNFLTKMQKFQFAPPSDNLWIVSIDSMDNDLSNTTALPTLYSSILQSNKAWNNKVSSQWNVSVDKSKAERYIDQFCSESGIFLAQSINFTPQSTTTLDQPFQEKQQHGAFLNFGYIAQSRQINRSLKISFLVSNWDIGDILFEPWIAAVAQRGLLERGITNQGGKKITNTIKARIKIRQYSSGVPKQLNNDEISRRMLCRKQYIFENCVPVNRGSIEKDYDPNNAGTFKNIPVQFKYTDYKIKYHI